MRNRIRPLPLAALFAALLASPADARVVLKDGTTLEGSATFAEGTVRLPDGRTFPKDEVRRIVWDRAAARGPADRSATAEATLAPAERAEFDAWLAEAAPLLAATPEAGALVLLDACVHTLRPDGTRLAASRYVVKLLKEARKDLAQVATYYTDGRDRVGIAARCIKPDGRVITLDPAALAVTDPPSDASTFVKYKCISGNLPEVEVGDLLDLRYTTEEFNPFDRDLWFPQFYFQGRDPVRRGEVEFRIPKERELFFDLRNLPGGKTPAVTVEGDQRVYRLALTALAPYVEEPLTPAYADVTPYLQASLFRGWERGMTWVRDLWRKHSEPTAACRALAADLTKGCTTEAERAAVLLHWVEKNIRYVIIKGDWSTIWGSYPADLIREQKFGCCVDKAQVLAALLRAVGIRAVPVAINADSHLLSPDIATLSITHSITKAVIDGKAIFLDSTGYDHRYPSTPGMDHGRSVVDLETMKVERVPVPPPEANATLRKFEATLAADGGLTLRRVRTFTGDEEANRRGYWKSVKEDERDRVFLSVLNAIRPGAELVGFDLRNRDDLARPFETEETGRWKSYANRAGDLLILPLPDYAFDFPETALAVRRYPIAYPSSLLSAHDYEIRYDARALAPAFPPKNVSRKIPGVEFTCTFESKPGLLVVKSRFARSKTEFSLAEVGALKAFYEGIAKFAADPLYFKVLAPKEGDAR